MYHAATRLLALLELLQSHRRIGGAELSRRLCVDRRTLRRYVARLEELGVPVIAERGRDGGYGLVPGFRLPPMMFTEDEALALSLGLVAARGFGLSEAAPAAASAQAKLERVMPEPLQRRVRAVRETVALRTHEAESLRDNAALVTLGAAAQARQRVRLSYRSPEHGDSERALDPYGLAHLDGRWYVVGHCHLRGALRSFRVDRIRRVQPLPASFGRPDGFDPLDYLTRGIATLPRRHAIEVVIHADLEAVRPRVFAALGLLAPHADGTLLTAQADDLDWFARELAHLPFGCTVVAPAALRQALARLARRLADASARGDVKPRRRAR